MEVKPTKLADECDVGYERKRRGNDNTKTDILSNWMNKLSFTVMVNCKKNMLGMALRLTIWYCSYCDAYEAPKRSFNKHLDLQTWISR